MFSRLFGRKSEDSSSSSAAPAAVSAAPAAESQPAPAPDAPISDADLAVLNLSSTPKARVPIVYSDAYNISFMGLEKLHPFDSQKYKRVFNALTEERHLLLASEVYAPIEASANLLRLVHPQAYLESLKSSARVAQITEVPPVALLPNSVVQSRVLTPMRFATAGTLLAADLAYRSSQAGGHAAAGDGAAAASSSVSASAAAPAASAPPAAAGVAAGWSINLSGGYHHCSARQGGGFCAFADISLAIVYLAKKYAQLKRVMIVDCDAHQGNGHENDKKNGVFNSNGIDLDVFILDMYNSRIYPQDHAAEIAIDCAVRLKSGTSDEEYLSLLRSNLAASLDKHRPQLVIYNAGTDCLAGDALGRLDVSAEGICERDRIVFSMCRERGVPVVMLLSGGYQQSNAGVIASSIAGLHESMQLWTLDPACVKALEKAAAKSKGKAKSKDKEDL